MSNFENTMGTISTTTYWTPDTKTYQELQKLKKFVDFVAGLEYVSPEEKNNAEIIKQQIENFNQPYPTYECHVSLNLFNYDLRECKGKGTYRRKWSVCFERNIFEIEAKCQDVGDDYYKDNKTTYYGIIYFKKDIPCKRMYMETDINEFIADAMNYKSYINESLNEIEVNIEIWDIH